MKTVFKVLLGVVATITLVLIVWHVFFAPTNVQPFVPAKF